MHLQTCGIICVVRLLALGAAQDAEVEAPFPVHLMLEAAAALGPAHDLVSASCVPDAAQEAWRKEFHEAVEVMFRPVVKH